jgi:hypothetical protein
MPVVNKTKAEFLVLPLPPWFPIGAITPWPNPFTAGNLQSVLDKLEPLVESESVWDAIKTIFLSMPLSGFTSPNDFAAVIEGYCTERNLSAWEVEEPQ